MNKNEITWELCPNCENEVILKNSFKVQICPECGKKIFPCSICEYINNNFFICGKCPLDTEAKHE